MLTEKGIDLAPMIMEIVIWSDQYIREYNQQMNVYNKEKRDKKDIVLEARNIYKAFAKKMLQAS